MVVRWDVWFTFKTSPRSRPVVRSKATLMQQKLPFSNTYIRFPCKLSEIFFGGKVFRLEFSDIYPHRPRFLSFDVVDSGPSVCKHSFSPPPLDCDCTALPNDNCSHDLIVYM